MGFPYTDQYAQFRDALETFLRDGCKCDPRIMGRNEYPSGSPLKKIDEVMRGCHGVVVVAFERKYVETGLDKRSGGNPQKLRNQTYTTPWNQIEASMAFSLGLPLYIICEHGLLKEGLIEDKFDWYVQYSDMSKAFFTRPEVSESIRAWVASRVIPLSKTPRVWIALIGTLKFSEMTPKDVWTALGVIVTSFVAGAGAVTALPKLFH
jgi:hypothetical protein